MANSKRTGISGITGKTVSIRHATDADRVDVGEYFARHGRAGSELFGADITVAEEGDRLIGFAVLERSVGRGDAGCVTVVEDGRRRGIGLSILKHLADHTPVTKVYAASSAARYLALLGFRKKRAEADGSGVNALGRRKTGGRGAAFVVYERP